MMHRMVVSALGNIPSSHPPRFGIPTSLTVRSFSTPARRPYPRTPVTTTVGYYTPPCSKNDQSAQALRHGIKHMLHVDLSVTGELNRSDAVLDPSSGRATFLRHLRNVASLDRSGSALRKIDYVKFTSTSRREEPSLETYLALDGLSPHFLDIIAGLEGVCNLRHLDELSAPWNDLQTLYIENVENSLYSKDEFPHAISHIQGLTLDYCTNIRFCPPGGADRLKRLRIVNNNALDMFMFAFDANPLLQHTLEVLDLTSTNGVDLTHQYISEDFRQRLHQCWRIRHLTLSLAHDGLDTGLAPFLPKSLETLTFRSSCTPPMFDDLDIWIQQIQDDDWIPHLRSIRMPFDSLPGHPHHDVAPSEMHEFIAKRRIFFDLLRARRPSVESIVEEQIRLE